MLTIYLTASDTFSTRKDSGVLAPGFATGDSDPKTIEPVLGGQPRKVLYYVSFVQ